MKSAFSSSIRTCAHTPAQTGEEQSNHCYLYEGFTRLYFSLVIPGLIVCCEKAIQTSVPPPISEAERCIRAYLGALDYFQIPVPWTRHH